MDPFVLVVMEHASEWPDRVKGGVVGCVALRQERNESHGELLRRTYERIRSIERAGGTIEVALLSCNDDASVGGLAGRVPLARTLLATVLHSRNGRLELVARASAKDRVKHSLVALAGTLTEALAGSSASVSARFAEAISSSSSPHPKRRTSRSSDERQSAA